MATLSRAQPGMDQQSWERVVVVWQPRGLSLVSPGLPGGERVLRGGYAELRIRLQVLILELLNLPFKKPLKISILWDKFFGFGYVFPFWDHESLTN